MNTVKRHRVVLGESAFQRVAHLLNDRAVERAENEGWPIPADAHEPARAVSRTGVVRRMVVLLGLHVRRELHFWSRRAPLPMKRLHPRVQDAAP